MIQKLHHGPRKFLKDEEARIRSHRYERISPCPVSPTIGAVIEGVDLREPLDDATFAELERALVDFKAIFFRDQDLTTRQHLDFAGRFGPLEEHPFIPSKDGAAEVVQFAKDEQTVGVENNWHSDVSWREIPSLGSVLRAVDVPDVGGDTLFADMTAAYQGLSDELKERIDGMQAIHDFTQAFGWAMPKAERAKKQEEFPPARHPIVRTHPTTGQKILYVNAIFTSRIVGLDEAESEALLEELCRQAHIPEYQCRFTWQKNSIAFWDNRSTQHYASSDYWPKARVMERVTIIGERPA